MRSEQLSALVGPWNLTPLESPRKESRAQAVIAQTLSRFATDWKCNVNRHGGETRVCALPPSSHILAQSVFASRSEVPSVPRTNKFSFSCMGTGK